MAFPQLELRGLVSGAQKTGKMGRRQDFRGPFSGLSAGGGPKPQRCLAVAKLSESHNSRVIKSFWASGKLGFANRFLLHRTTQRSFAMTNPDQAVSQLSQSLAQAAESQRALAEEMTVFAKDEGLRFANLRLERNGATLEKLQNCHGVPGLIGVQQEWLRDLLQDYASQSMRLMNAMRGLTKNAMESAAENASDNIDRMQTQAQDAMERTSDAIDRAAEQTDHVVQDNNYVQETQH